MTAPLYAFLVLAVSQATDTIRFTLVRDSVISGVRCAPTGKARASIFPGGQLASCPISRDTVIGKARLVAGTWITLRESGSVRSVWLQKPTEIQGVPCRGDGYKTWSTDLFPDGQLQRCFLSKGAAIDGVPCRNSWFWSEIRGSTHVSLHHNGRLRSCVLSMDFERGGARFRKNQRVELDSAGVVVRRDGRPL